MHISLLPPLFDFLMSFLQISPQLIKVKQNSDFRSRGGVMGDKKKCRESIYALCNWSVLNPYTDAKSPPLSRHNRWQDSKLSSGSKVRFARVSGVSSIDLPGTKMRWRRSLLQYSLPGEFPCVSSAKQLGAEGTEPCATLWQSCNTWKQQPCSQVMTNWVENWTNMENVPNKCTNVWWLRLAKQYGYMPE